MTKTLSQYNKHSKTRILCAFFGETKSFSLYIQLDLQLQDESGGDVSSFITNGEWELLGEWKLY